jgi:sodium-dependent dicarboxylate transporter 2/3/5
MPSPRSDGTTYGYGCNENDECRMTNDEGMTNDESPMNTPDDNGRVHSSLGIRHSFVIRHWGFVIPLLLGPLVLVGWIYLVDVGLPPEAHKLAGILLLTLIWWVTEPIPIAATGLLGVALCVVLGAIPPAERGREGLRLVFAPFADPSVFFLMGGMFIGRAMTRHGLDRRIALALLCTRWAGRTPGTVLTTVALATMLISMWISNAAATAMMCPVAVGIVTVLAAAQGAPADFARSPYATALILGVAFSSSVGGIATPIGTATNVVAIGIFRRPEYFGRGVDFLAWSAVGVPMMVLIFVGLCAWLRWLAPAHGLDMTALRHYLRNEYERLGPWKRGEVNTLIVFLAAIAMWVTPGLLALSGSAEAQRAFNRCFPEEVTAVLALILLFLLPTDREHGRFTLEAEDWQKIDWGTLLLFGGALALGGLMFRTGLADAVGTAAFERLGTHDPGILTAVAIAAGILLSEFTSNTATASALLPVVYSLCIKAGVDPVPPMLALTFGTSFGSALPVSTPPNAIAYGTGLTPVRRMIGAGLGLDFMAGIIVWGVLRVAFEVLHWAPLERP